MIKADWYTMGDKYYGFMSDGKEYIPAIYITQEEGRYIFRGFRMAHVDVKEQYLYCNNKEYTGGSKERDICNKLINIPENYRRVVQEACTYYD